MDSPEEGDFFFIVNVAFGPVSRGTKKGYTVSTARCRRSFETARDTLLLIAGVLTSTGCIGVVMALLVAYHCVGVQVCCLNQNQTKLNGCAAFLFERSEFLIDTSQKKSPRVCTCARVK